MVTGVCVYIYIHTHRDTDTDTHTHTQTQTQTQTQTDANKRTDGRTDRQTDRQTDTDRLLRSRSQESSKSRITSYTRVNTQPSEGCTRTTPSHGLVKAK